ncbi:MAG: DNA-directed RNA polymerase III subunit RPC4, partial [Paramarteilia canceri]
VFIKKEPEKPNVKNSPSKPRKSNEKFHRKQNLIQTESVFDKGFTTGDTSHNLKNLKKEYSINSSINEQSFSLNKSKNDTLQIKDLEELNQDVGDNLTDQGNVNTAIPLEFPKKSSNTPIFDELTNHDLIVIKFPNEIGEFIDENGKKINPFESIKSGNIGSLQRYKSGKMSIVIGNRTFSVKEQKDTPFSKILLREDVLDSSSKLSDLGNVKLRYVALPDIENLISGKATYLSLTFPRSERLDEESRSDSLCALF